jgi:hypothetical protein
MRGKTLRKNMKFMLLVCISACLFIILGTGEVSFASIAPPPTTTYEYQVSGSITPTQNITNAWLLTTTSGWNYVGAIYLGNLSGNTATNFSNLTFSTTVAPGPFSSSVYTIVGLYDGSAGMTVGMSQGVASSAIGQSWEQHFGDQSYYWPEDEVITVLGMSTPAGYLLDFCTQNQGAYQAYGGGQLLGANNGTELSLINFSSGILGGTATFNATPVPLPSALLLFGPGLVGLAGIRRRFKK